MLGYGYDPLLSEGAVKPPVFLTSTFVFRSAEEGRDFFDYTAGAASRRRARRRARLFALQPSQQRDRRGSPGGLRRRGVLHPVLVGHVGHRHDHPDVRQARRCHSAFAAALRRHRDAGVAHADGLRHRGRRIRRWRRRGQLREAAAMAEGKGRVSVIMIETPSNPLNTLVDIRLVAASPTRSDRGRGSAPSSSATTPCSDPSSSGPWPSAPTSRSTR